MPAPVQNTQITPQSQARLTGAYVGQTNIRAWLAAMLVPAQNIENDIFAILQARVLANVTLYTLPQTNGVLDVIGALVGQPRSGLSDLQYKVAIYLRIAANRATGRISDWSTFGAILVRAGAAPIVTYYATTTETPGMWGPAFYFGVWNCANGAPDPLIAASCLDLGVVQGVQCCFAYSTWPDGGDFAPGSIYATWAGQGGLADTNLSATGGNAVSAVALA